MLENPVERELALCDRHSITTYGQAMALIDVGLELIAESRREDLDIEEMDLNNVLAAERIRAIRTGAIFLNRSPEVM
jgi:hypothetical protein